MSTTGITPRRTRIGLCAALVAFGWTTDGHTRPRASLRIAVLVDGPSSAQVPLQSARAELQKFGHQDPELFPKDQVRTGDFTVETARRQLDEALADPKVDVVWAFGLLASTAAVQRSTSGRLPKPVLAPFVLAPSKPLLDERPHAASSNLSYVIWTPALSRDLAALRSVRPVRNVAYLLPEAIRKALPTIETLLTAEARKAGVQLTFASGTDPEAVVRSLPADTDAVYVGPDPRRGAPELEVLAAALIARRLPSFSQVGRPEVERGLLMGLGGRENLERLARAVAVNTDAILQGEVPGKLTYGFQQVEDLVVNAATATALGIPLSWTVLSEAELIAKEEATSAREIGLGEVITEVRARNLQLRANVEDLAAAEQSVREAFGALLPALDGSVSANWIDPDGANGANPERSASWSGTASQVVVNEPALANLTINKHLRDATRFDNRTAILDAMQSAGIAYLNVLRARVTESIQRDNLKVTRTELAQARLRVQLGTGSRNEILRLENQLATNRKSVIDASASRNVAEIELLRLLNLSAEEPFRPRDVSLESSALMATGDRLQIYMTGPDRFDRLRQFMAEEAIRNAPELQASESRLAAQRRLALSNRLAPFLPQVSVSGRVTHIFATGGEGAGADAPAFLPFDELSWQVGLTASLRLWEGNARYARIEREMATARGQNLDLEARRVQIRAAVRSALHQAGATYAGIGLQREAADAADENLELVQQAYARGKEDIITLVDAQNQALTGKLNASNAVYDFLVDLIEVQRAMGRFEFAMSEAEVDEFFERLKVFASLQEKKND